MFLNKYKYGQVSEKMIFFTRGGGVNQKTWEDGWEISWLGWVKSISSNPMDNWLLGRT